MKGIMMIIMLIGLLVFTYLLMMDYKSRQEQNTSNIQVIEKTRQVEEKVRKAGEAAQRRLTDLAGE